MVLMLLVATACATGSQRAARPTTGGIAGLARDMDSGDPVAKAQIRITGGDAPRVTISGDNGLYDLEKLVPGKYVLVAEFAGQPIEVTNIDVLAGQITMVDIVFTLGRPEPIRVDFGNAKASKIERYRPRNGTKAVSIIEGTVNDTATKQRVAGAVVTAVTGEHTHQTVSDDHGRFRFEATPGTYVVSAYYSVGGRGQIEVRRSDIAVEGAEAVVVPLWIEMNR
jgi:hypothetical protein